MKGSVIAQKDGLASKVVIFGGEEIFFVFLHSVSELKISNCSRAPVYSHH